MYKIWQGRQLFHQTFWMQSEYLLDSLNFAAFTKPNKHKMDSKNFSSTWPNLFSNTFTTVGELERLLQSFFSNRFSRHDGTVLPVPVTSTSGRSSSPPSPTHAFWLDKSSQNPSPAVNFKRGISLKRFRYLPGLEKYLNSTLPVGQVTLKFCLPGALPRLLKFSNSLIIYEPKNGSQSTSVF